ncbi:MAG: CHAT domain-containing protein [Bacteroidota bacterium]
MLPLIEEIIEIFQEGDPDQKLAFVDSCPMLDYKEQAKQAIQQGPGPEASYQSLDFLARGCLKSGHYELAERISESYYLLARTSFDLNLGDSFSLRYYAGRGAINWMSALQFQGEHKQLNNLIDEPLRWLKATGDADNYELLSLKKVESFLDLEEFNKAQKAFKEISEPRLSATNLIHYSTIEYRIRMRKGGKTQLPIDFIDPAEKESHEMNAVPVQEESAVRQNITEASYLLTDPMKGSDPVEIAKVEPDLISGRDWMRDHHFPRAENDACWSLYLAYNRTNRDGLAVEQLQRIRSNIENARSQVSDPAERSRLLERFPYLYPCLCTLFYKLGRYEDLLEAIEASKSRILADQLTQEKGEPATERDFSMAVKELSPMLGRLNSHYYTCFVDDDCVYGVLLTSSGNIKASKTVINRERIEYYASISNPELWGQPDPIDPIRRRIPEDLTMKLGPFVKVFHTALENHEITEGDHICYSSNDALLHIPFHYMDLNGKYLVDFFSLSRIPGVYALQRILNRNVYIPKKYTAVEVPAVQDMNGKESAKPPGESARWLGRHLNEGKLLRGEEADLEAMAQADLGACILHFNTHGRVQGDKVPGLVLAANQKLPDLLLMKRGGAEEHLLTPDEALKPELDFSNSHVTLQACVSAPARKGLRGDPPGLEWAFMHRGAASILAPHWQVPVRTATLFINTFYKNWLELGYSRANAWRTTVLELRGKEPGSHPFNWAAFSLSGDWR